ncbi:MAG: AI-2E family transporter [Sphingomicrobium sp.]
MNNRAVGVAQIITGGAAVVALLYFLRVILIPFVIAYVLAVLVSALVRFIQNRWVRAPAWAVTGLAGLIVIIFAAGGIFAMAQGGAQIVAQGPALLGRLDAILQDLGRSLHLPKPVHLATVVGSISVPQLAGQVLQGLQGLVSGLLLMIVYFGFLLAGRQRMARKIVYAAGSSRRATTIRNAIAHIATDIETYIWVQTVTGLMITAAAAVVMLAVGLNNVLFWAVIFFLLSFIPNIGVTIGSVAPALFALVQFPSTWQAITIFGVIQLAAFVVGNLVYPRMQAQTQNIDPLVTMLSLALWSVLWGIAGAFLAVPMTLMLMMGFAQFKSTRWITAMLSNDGRPSFPPAR